MARTKGAVDKNPRRPRGSGGEGGGASSEPPAAGHNSELTEADRRALLVQNMKNIQELKAAATSASGKLRQGYQKAKAEGFTKDDIDYAIRLRTAKPEELIEQRRRERELAKFLNHPIGTEPDMFDEPDRTPAADHAFEEGKLQGLEGEPCRPPHHFATEQSQKWIAGWHEGTADRVRNVIKTPPEQPTGSQPAPQDDGFSEALDTEAGADAAPSTAPEAGEDFESEVSDAERARRLREGDDGPAAGEAEKQDA
jgi:ribosome modulation factor